MTDVITLIALFSLLFLSVVYLKRLLAHRPVKKIDVSEGHYYRLVMEGATIYSQMEPGIEQANMMKNFMLKLSLLSRKPMLTVVSSSDKV